MTRFFKLSGGGNDFIALAEPAEDPPAASITAWCRRGISEGADGVFLLEREPGAVRMRHFNADGTAAELCVNGTRCAARLAFELGWATDEVRITTDAGSLVASRAAAGAVSLEMMAPSGTARPLELTLDDATWHGWYLIVGVPHLVLFWDRPMAEAPVSTVGRSLRWHADLAPDGANVDFVSVSSAHDLELRTFERGVEAETLACGSGALAAAAVVLAQERAELPLTVLTKGGFRLVIEPAEQNGFWRITGDARLVASGELAVDAAIEAEAPGW